MLSIEDRNVNHIFPRGLLYIREEGVARDSRNGSTVEIFEPVAVTYLYADERVLFNKERDCNPFFHLFESLWMLAGRRDVEFVSRYNSRISQYSDDGITFHAAYGHRLRKHFLMDQLQLCINKLKENPDDRRVVLQLWDPIDLNINAKDLACNVVMIPRIRDGYLDMTVMNRSNDYLWGMTGANVVHMSIIQEYIARMVGVELGHYTQISNCLHAYTDVEIWDRCKDTPLIQDDEYMRGEVEPYPLITEPEEWDNDLTMWMHNPADENMHYSDPFFEFVAKPMAIAFKHHKENNCGLDYVERIGATDWRLACYNWLYKRENQLNLRFDKSEQREEISHVSDNWGANRRAS